VASAPRELDRPAFYALRAGGWRDLVTLLHPPYTAWHLSYVVLGAAVAPTVHADRVGAALAAFALAVGVAAHALDELHGRPLRTRLSNRALVALAGGALAGAVAIGIAGALTVSLTLIPFIAAGIFLTIAYSLELAGGRFHSDAWFALAWGGFPALTSYWANALSVHASGGLVVAACIALSVAQRRLSTPVRQLRRRTAWVTGAQRLTDGQIVELTSSSLAAPLDGALAALSAALVLLAAATLIVRL
jgi:hypothetical protein